MNNNENNNRFINNVSNVNSTALDLSNNTPNNVNPKPVENINNENNNEKPPVAKPQPVENKVLNQDNLQNETSLNALNVDGKYNKLEKSPFSDEQAVRENIASHEKKTVKITVTQDMKLFIIIAAIMLVFIIIMPFIFDFIENIRFN